MTVPIWQQYGLRQNPFDTLPLVEGGEIPINQAFIGREQERSYLDSLYQLESKGAIIIEGKLGVGKTSLANYQKNRWRNDKNKPLFSFRREIEANSRRLTKEDFILDIIGSCLREIELVDKELIPKHKFLQRLSRLVDITETISFSSGIEIAGFGGEFGKTKSIEYPSQLTATLLEKYLNQLIEFILTTPILKVRYHGLIVHINNFDTVLNSKEGKAIVINFMHEIRDLLQISNVYYIFIGPEGFFNQILAKEARIKPVFTGNPIKLLPLNKLEFKAAIKERFHLLKSHDVQDIIRPFDDQLLAAVYDLYQGDIRSLMGALRDILVANANNLPKTLTKEEGLISLAQERWHKIKLTKLSKEQEQVLLYMSKFEKISQKEIAHHFHKAQTNVSGYYFAPLHQNNIIELVEKSGRVKYWSLSKEYMPIKYLDLKPKYQAEVAKRIGIETNQLRMQL